MNRQPAFQFYTGDWRKDPELSRCSKAAKGVWIDALALLWDMPIRGVFCSADGLPWPLVDIAYAIGGDIQENLACLSELTAKGVVRVRADGALFSKRMVDDEATRNAPRIEPRSGRESIPTRVRRMIMGRYRHQCVECGASEDLEIDHIRAVAHGGGNEETNLQVLCRPCNRQKGPFRRPARRER